MAAVVGYDVAYRPRDELFDKGVEEAAEFLKLMQRRTKEEQEKQGKDSLALIQ